MNIENRVLFNLFQSVKTGYMNYEMSLNGYGLYIEGFTGGITIYAKSKVLYRQTIYGDNKLHFCSYIDSWNKKDGKTFVENLESMSRKDGDKTAQKICEFIILFETEKSNHFSVTGREFRKVVNGVDIVNKGEKEHNIVLSAYNGSMDIASWNYIESGVWRLESKADAHGAVMVPKKHLDHIKGKTLEFACMKHNKLNLYVKGDIEAIIPTKKIDSVRFLEVLEYDYISMEKANEDTKSESRKRVVKRAPKQRKENSGWIYNKLGTKQTKVCNW